MVLTYTQPKSNFEKSKKRMYEIDIARGIAIVLVIIGHSLSDTHNVINQWILSFHMPLFFVISGICFDDNNTKFLVFLKKKIKHLIVPQLTLGGWM